MSIYEVSIETRIRVAADDAVEAASVALSRLSGPVHDQVQRLDLGDVKVKLLSVPRPAVVKPHPGEIDNGYPHIGASDLGCLCIKSCCNDDSGNCTCPECPNTEHRYHKAA